MIPKNIAQTIGLFFLLTFILSCGPSTPGQLFVSPSGSDTNEGSREAPFQTITRARDYIRSLDQSGRRQSLEVILSGGTYFIDETIVFNVIT